MIDYTKGYIMIDLFSGIVAPFLLSHSIIQSIVQDKKAGNFILTNHSMNPYFEWGEVQIFVNWAYNAVITSLMIVIFSVMFNKSFTTLLVFNILNLLFVATLSYIFARNFSETLTYVLNVGAIIISLIARVPLFDKPMLLVPPTWEIRFNVLTSYNPKNFGIAVLIFVVSNVSLMVLNYLISKTRSIA